MKPIHLSFLCGLTCLSLAAPPASAATADWQQRAAWPQVAGSAGGRQGTFTYLFNSNFSANVHITTWSPTSGGADPSNSHVSWTGVNGLTQYWYYPRMRQWRIAGSYGRPEITSSANVPSAIRDQMEAAWRDYERPLSANIFPHGFGPGHSEL